MSLSQIPPDEDGPPLWIPIPNAPEFEMAFPANIISAILSFLPRSAAYPNDTTTIHRETLLPLASTSRWFRRRLRNEVYASLYLTSPAHLHSLATHMGTYAWEDQECAIQSLTLHWDHRIDFAEGYPKLSTALSRLEIAQQMIRDLQLLLQNSTDDLQELTLHFPGAVACLQDALLGHNSPLYKHQLKKLSIHNGGRPIFPNARHILCAISGLAWDTLETLKLDGGAPALEGSWQGKKLPAPKLQFPSQGTFSEHPPMEQLRHLEVRNLAGFYDEHLLWLLSGVEMLSVYRRWSIYSRSHSLALEGNPHITRGGIVAALEAVGDGLDELRISHLRRDCMPGYSPPHPKKSFLPCYWGWHLEGGFQLMGGMEQRFQEDHLCDAVRYYCRNLKRLEIYTHTLCRNIFFPPPPLAPPSSLKVVGLRLPSSHGEGEATLCCGERGAAGLLSIADEAVDKGVVSEFVRIRGFWRGRSRFRFKLV